MLINRTEIAVRFSEIDSLGILWHGHYIKYFEDGREAFGKEFSLGYMDVFAEGFTTPLVNIECNFKSPIRYKDEVIVETKFIDSAAAKILFEFHLFNKITGETFAKGKSQQVFLTKDNQLHLTLPDFFVAWKKKWGFLK